MGKIIFSPISKHLKLDFSMSHSDERSISEEISPKERENVDEEVEANEANGESRRARVVFAVELSACKRKN